MSDNIGWLLVVWVVFLTDLFMCAFSMNGIHICTSHEVHFVYYGCGFIPVALYWRMPPHGWIVPFYIICRLAIHTCFKNYVWPKYPSPFEIVPLYVWDDAAKEYRVGSKPEFFKTGENGDTIACELGGNPIPKPGAPEFLKNWAVPFPACKLGGK